MAVSSFCSNIFESVQEYPYYLTKNGAEFDIKVVEEIYHKQLITEISSMDKKVKQLEEGYYLENYLWTNICYLKDHDSKEYVISFCILLNEKIRVNKSYLNTTDSYKENFQIFFNALVKTLFMETITNIERCPIILFIINCCENMEHESMRKQVSKIVSLSIWVNISEKRLNKELSKSSAYKKYWNSMLKKNSKSNNEDSNLSRNLLVFLMDKFFDVIEDEEELSDNNLMFAERMVELIFTLESCLPTRRFVHTLIDDHNFLVRCLRSKLYTDYRASTLKQLIDLLTIYEAYEVDELSGKKVSLQYLKEKHYKNFNHLQRIVFKLYGDKMKEFCLTSVSNADSKDVFLSHIQLLTYDQLTKIMDELDINYNNMSKSLNEAEKLKFVQELLAIKFVKKSTQIQRINEIPLYPTEQVMWNDKISINENVDCRKCLPLHRLHLQFVNIHDYLLRNFTLYFLESSFEIRNDIEDAITRLKPYLDNGEDSRVGFSGWARMALPINEFSVNDVYKPLVGYNHPSKVRATVEVTLPTRIDLRLEWRGLKKYDPCFLVAIDPALLLNKNYAKSNNFQIQNGILAVRGCEIESSVLDEEEEISAEDKKNKITKLSTTFTYKVLLDPVQYYLDYNTDPNLSLYKAINVLVRRKPKENNFKSVLETIRDLMNEEDSVSDWLHDILLGYDDPFSAHYTKQSSYPYKLIFNDTFLNKNHLIESFKNKTITFVNDNEQFNSPYEIEFISKDKLNIKSLFDESSSIHLIKKKRNILPFTPMQIEAIVAGTSLGLNIVVGPPGTGKTDVAVQIVANLYHNYPNEKILIITHSNQALNQLFEKIIRVDVNEKHLLRLGHGEEELDTEKEFSKYGRVNYILTRRLELLNLAEKIKNNLKIVGDFTFCCETAVHFFHFQVCPRWSSFIDQVSQNSSNPEIVAELFPFNETFDEPINFTRTDFNEDLKTAKQIFDYITELFTELEEYRAFELLRSTRNRSNYLLTKTAKIIAMTCTHASLRRSDLLKLNFHYDTVIIEESAQMLEIETFISLFIQSCKIDKNRLKRITLIGDHHQLPPVIKNMTLQNCSNMSQSLFSRLIRLEVPHIMLDAQGRCRPELSQLFSWYYSNLKDLSSVNENPMFHKANAGFNFIYQFINVDDFDGIGESEPNPHFIQNLAEAEYAVAIFMYMRLIGYEADKISILTTYNGQKHLIRDVIKKRCGDNPLIGIPHVVTTVDRYQGNQNDYIILSLVRSKIVGHLRDVRRLIVALSRARLGLYVVGRLNLFINSLELKRSFQQLSTLPTKLHLVPSEIFGDTERQTNQLVDQPLIVEDMKHMCNFVYELYREKMKIIELNKIKAELPQEPVTVVEDQTNELEYEGDVELSELNPST